jgi:ubiquinone/menaquinone biosynthesis C-methylase UbiE
LSRDEPDQYAAKALIRATFNAAATHFDDPPLFFWDHFARRTVELAGVTRGDRVLDVCCGAGASALVAAERVGPAGRVVGVDLAERLLERARVKARERGLRNVDFVVGDMTGLDGPRGAFDAVICVLGIYFAQDLPAAVAGLWRMVSPGGALTITTWGRRALEPANTLYLDAVAAERPDLEPRPSRLTWSRIDRPSTLAAVFRAAGLGSPTLVQETVVHPTNAEDFWTVVLGSGYRFMLETMGAAAAERVRVAFTAGMVRQGVQDLTADVLYASARKDKLDGRVGPNQPWR